MPIPSLPGYQELATCRQRLDVADKPLHLALEFRQRQEARHVDRDEKRVLIVPLTFRRAFERLGEDRIAGEQARQAFDEEREARAFRATERQWNGRGARVRRWFAFGVESQSSGERLAAAPRLRELADRDHARAHIHRE